MKRIGPGLLGLVATLSAEGAIAATFGNPNDLALNPFEFNVFVLGDFSQSNTDAEGRVAVGGNFTHSSFGVNADGLTTSPALVVGNDASLTNGEVGSSSSSTISGDAQIGGALSGSNTTILGDLEIGSSQPVTGVNVNGQTTVNSGLQTELVNDFAESANYLQELSTYLANQSGTPLTPVYGGITANASSGLNIFEVDGDTFGSANSFSVNGPSDATIVFNISGNTVSAGNFEIFLNNQAKCDQPGAEQLCTRVLYNLFEADAFNAGSINLDGTVLAPGAVVDASYGAIDGTLIAGSLTGNIEAHNFLFAGELPEGNGAGNSAGTDPTPVPTPALLPGLLGMVGMMRKRLSAA